MGRDRRPSFNYYDSAPPAPEPIRPNPRNTYDAPISYGDPPAQPQSAAPAGYYAVPSPGTIPSYGGHTPYNMPQPLSAAPTPGLSYGALPAGPVAYGYPSTASPSAPQPQGWYGIPGPQAHPAVQAAMAAFAPYGAKPAGVRVVGQPDSSILIPVWVIHNGMYIQSIAMANNPNPNSAGPSTSSSSFSTPASPLRDEPAGPDRPSASMICIPLASTKATTMEQHAPRWDMRFKPGRNSVRSREGQGVDLNQPATNPPTRRMLLVSTKLPWAINIKNENNSVLTAGDVLDGIYENLQEPITRDEFFCAPEQKRKELLDVASHESARDAKRSKSSSFRGGSTGTRGPEPIRLDWLDQHVEFRGLFFDNEIAEGRFPWKKDDIMDAWVFDFGKAGRDDRDSGKPSYGGHGGHGHGSGRNSRNDDDDDDDDDDEDDD